MLRIKTKLQGCFKKITFFISLTLILALSNPCAAQDSIKNNTPSSLPALLKMGIDYGFYYGIESDKLSDIKIGANFVPDIKCFNPELTFSFRKNRFFEYSFNAGATNHPGGENIFQKNQYPDGYNVHGSFIKAGVKNYLLNTFFSSRFDVFTGLYYIGSLANETYPDIHSSNQINRRSLTSAMALQSGLNCRLGASWTLDAGVQYTFLSSRKENAMPFQSYQPGIGKWQNGHALQGIFTIHYIIDLRPYNICCIHRYYYNKKGYWFWVPCGWWNRSVRYL